MRYIPERHAGLQLLDLHQEGVPRCAPFYVPRSDPDKIDVNARCLDAIDLAALTIETFDGAHWEAHYEVYRAARNTT